MHGPWGGAVLNTLLSGRPYLTYSAASSSRSVLKTAGTHAARQKFPQDFFTPRPRRVKGKERAGSENVFNAYTTAHDAEETRTSNAARKPSSVSPSHPCRRPRRMSAHKFLRSLPRVETNILGDMTRRSCQGQRRHVSTVPKPASSSSSPYELEKAKETLWAFANLNRARWEGDHDPDAVWRAYELLQEANGCEDIPIHALLDVTSRLADNAHDPKMRLRTLESMPLWGSRLQTLLNNVTDRIPPDKPIHLRWSSLHARARAMKGEYAEAIETAQAVAESPKADRDSLYVVEIYSTVIFLMSRTQHPLNAFEVLLADWDIVRQFLVVPLSFRDANLFAGMRSFQQVVKVVLSGVEGIWTLIDPQKKWPPDRLQEIASYFVDVLAKVNLPEDANTLIEMMQQRRLQVDPVSQLSVVMALAKDGSILRANELFSSLARICTTPELERRYQSCGLTLFAHQAKPKQAEEYFDKLANTGTPHVADINMLLHAYALGGDTERVVELFYHFFPYIRDPSLPQRQEANVRHFTTVINAHAQRGDLDGMHAWLDRMVAAGLSPDNYVYSIILNSFAQRGEISSMTKLLDQMRAGGVRPTENMYTTIISLLARRKDPTAAEAVYKRAIDEGVVPDRRMVGALMHAHVEAGNWSGVIRAFDYIKASGKRGLRLTTDIFNTLLKAYVLIGSPFRVVAALFQRLERARVKPDRVTFTLLIQSACDSGLMRIAADLVSEMDRMSEHWENNFELDVYVLSILMAGYLRLGRKLAARDVYETMKARGIDPSALTYGAIIRSYANEKSGEGLKIAEEFLMTLVAEESSEKSWRKPVGKRMLPLETVYAPLLVQYSYRRDPEAVERLYQDMLDHGGEPTIGSLTSLLDAYRRKGDIESVKRVWPQLLELGLRDSNYNSLFQSPADRDSPNLRSHGTSLCIPLSIYVDALSAAGQHDEIHTAWTALKSKGQAFDSHNWNHLSVALIRAGEPERAFEVIERVLIPYRARVQASAVHRDRDPQTPFTELLPPVEEADDFPAPPNESPMHARERRASAVASVNRRVFGLEDEAQDDFAHALHLLHRVYPLWNHWRPHGQTLKELRHVLNRLQTGRMIQPVRPPTQERSRERRTAEEVAPLREEARQTLARIYEKYPKTVRLIREYEIVRRTREAGESLRHSTRR